MVYEGSTESNGVQSTAWGNGTNYYGEVRLGANGTGRNFMVGIQNGNTGPGITAPANISRHDAYFNETNLTFSYAENGVWATNRVTTNTLEANTTYIVEVKVEESSWRDLEHGLCLQEGFRHQHGLDGCPQSYHLVDQGADAPCQLRHQHGQLLA